jgi:hypothetical protein
MPRALNHQGQLYACRSLNAAEGGGDFVSARTINVCETQTARVERRAHPAPEASQNDRTFRVSDTHKERRGSG